MEETTNTTNSTIETTNAPTLSSNQQKPARIKPGPTAQTNAVQESSSAAFSRRVRRPEKRFRSKRRRTLARKASNNTCGGGGEELDEKDEVEEKIVALQKIVPGGEALAVENLFEETAEYIVALKHQVEVLRFLTAFVQGPAKEKRKLGG